MPAYAVKQLEVYKKQAKLFYAFNEKIDLVINKVNEKQGINFDKAEVEWITENVIVISFFKNGTIKERIYITTLYEEIRY